MMRTIFEIGITVLSFYNIATAILIVALGHNVYYPTEQNTALDYLFDGFLLFISPLLIWMLWRPEKETASAWNAKEEVEKFRNKEEAG